MPRHADRPAGPDEWLARLDRLARAAGQVSRDCDRLLYPLDEHRDQLRAAVPPRVLLERLARASVALGLAAYRIRPLVRLLDETTDTLRAATGPEEGPEAWLRRQLDGLGEGRR